MNPPAPAQLLAAVDRSRPPKTFADYAAVAICPLLIMLLVGCLVFFLVEIGYAGTHLGKLRWTLFWFVLAMVLISRIAIEKGYDHAGLYGLGLAAATAFVLTQYVSNYLGAWCLLALIWWATNKLTWDCTVIDDDLDASGEGLLQAAKLDKRANETGEEAPVQKVRELKGASSRHRAPPHRPSWWKFVYPSLRSSSNQPHAPGRWVIYFLLAALPGFGLGQGLIPAGDEAARLRAFVLLLGYILAALGLLLVTSFLGLRRYLRQRHLAMPGSVSVSWISLGSTIILGILLVCILLPRPDRAWLLGGMLDKFGDPVSRPSKKLGPAAEYSQNATGQGIAPATDGTMGAGKTAPQGEQPSSSNSNSNASVAGGDRASGDNNNAAGQGPGNGRHPGGHTAAEQTSGSSARFSRPHTNWLKVLVFAGLAVVVIGLLFKNREGLWMLWQKLWTWWRSLWAGSSKAGRRASPEGSRRSPPPTPSFAAFRNPFASGEASNMPESELVVYSFEALQAWAAGFGLGRTPKETPFEFAHHLAGHVPELASDVEDLTRLYVCVAYGDSEGLSPCRGGLEILWSKLTRELQPPLADPEHFSRF